MYSKKPPWNRSSQAASRKTKGLRPRTRRHAIGRWTGSSRCLASTWRS